MELLETVDLNVKFRTKRGIVNAVNGVSCTLKAGHTLGIVGESGCGKSALAMSVLRLLDTNGYIESGAVYYKGTDLTRLSEEQLYKIRGNEISVIFQEPMTSLNPVFTIGRQIAEVFIVHESMSRHEANVKVKEMLEAVNIPNADSIAKQYPHQLSGGMRQRVMIAMALSCRPKILIADEPTTALDVTIQAQILNLMNDLKHQTEASILFITHDLGIISHMADDVAVMYCGEIVESGTVTDLFGGDEYSHPYTEGLFNSIPSIDTNAKRLEPIAGTLPNPVDLPKGCKFAPRCKYAMEVCTADEPKLLSVKDGHYVRCHFPVKGVRSNGKR